MKIVEFESNFVSRARKDRLSLSLSIADISIWVLCKTEGDILLTSDGTLRKMAIRHGIETHGLLWIFQEMIDNSTLTPKQAIEKLEHIFRNNTFYRTDRKLIAAFEKMKTTYIE